jgi:hypothetical protein
MSIKEDQERLAELRLKVFGNVAKKLLLGDKEPYWLTKDQIEGHGGRIEKALRLLREGGYLGRIHTEEIKGPYNSHSVHIYEILKFDEESAQYGNPDTLDTFNKDLRMLYGFSDPVHAGYVDINQLSCGNAITVWHHKGEYRYIPGQGVYPLIHERTHNIAVLRCIIEQRLAETYKVRFQKKVNLSGELPEEHERRIDHRNIGYSPSLLSDAGLCDYEGEYLHWERYFRSLRQNLIAFRDTIKGAGGPAEVIKQMRLECMAELMHEAPLFAIKKGVDDDAKGKAKFILQSSSLFDYEIIYGQDPSVTHIEHTAYGNEGHVAEGISELFAPAPEDAAIAAQAKE